MQALNRACCAEVLAYDGSLPPKTIVSKGVRYDTLPGIFVEVVKTFIQPGPDSMIDAVTAPVYCIERRQKSMINAKM